MSITAVVIGFEEGGVFGWVSAAIGVLMFIGLLWVVIWLITPTSDE